MGNLQTDGFFQKHPQPRLLLHCKSSSRIEKSQVFRINHLHSEQNINAHKFEKKTSNTLAWWSKTLAFGSRDSELASENKFDHKSLAVFSKRRPKRVITNYHSLLSISQHSLLWKNKLQLTQSHWVPCCCCESHAAVSIVCK